MHFGYDIISQMRPKTVVELGAYSGLSFFTFCQSMVENNVDGTLYAVDTWQGDQHTGPIDEGMYQQVENHARKYYRGISYLLRTTFAEASEQFDEASIDLLHIDGLHTYDAVKKDFITWFPKVKPGGIILMHDIAARLEGFGVRKFWEELVGQYSTFAFSHGYGLGVLLKPEGDRAPSELESLLFNGDEESHSRLRKLYTHIGRYHEALRRVKNLEHKLASIKN